MSLWARWFF